MPPFFTVTVEPFRPKEKPLLLEKTTLVRLFDVVPAETLMAVTALTLAVMVPMPAPVESPKLTPLPLAKVRAERLLEVVPAETLMLPCELATVADAVMFDPSKPKEMLLALLIVNAVTFELVVPADTLMAVMSVPFPVASPSVWLLERLHTRASAPPLLLMPKVTVDAFASPTWNIGPRW